MPGSQEIGKRSIIERLPFVADKTTMLNYLISNMLKVIISIAFSLYILKKTDSHLLEYENV